MRAVSIPGEIPLIVENRASRTVLVRNYGGGATFLAMGLVTLSTASFQGQGILSAAPFIFIFASSYFLWSAITQSGAKIQTSISRDTVEVEVQSLRGKRTWSEPLSAYAGVRIQSYVPRKDTGSETRVHFIDLLHPDSDKTVLLAIHRDATKNPRSEWEQFVKLLGLPGIDARGAEALTIEPDDISKSLGKAAERTGAYAVWEVQAAPDGVKVEHGGDASKPDTQVIRIQLPGHPIPKRLVPICFVILGAVLFWSILVQNGGVAVVVACMAIALWFLERQDKSNPPRLSISRADVAYSDRFGDARSFRIPVERIKSVRIQKLEIGRAIGRVFHRPGGKIILETDTHSARIKCHLSNDALIYVREILRSAIATA